MESVLDGIPVPAQRAPQYRSFGDAPTTRSLIYQNALAAARGFEPIENQRYPAGVVQRRFPGAGRLLEGGAEAGDPDAGYARPRDAGEPGLSPILRRASRWQPATHVSARCRT